MNEKKEITNYTITPNTDDNLSVIRDDNGNEDLYATINLPGLFHYVQVAVTNNGKNLKLVTKLPTLDNGTKPGIIVHDGSEMTLYKDDDYELVMQKFNHWMNLKGTNKMYEFARYGSHKLKEKIVTDNSGGYVDNIDELKLARKQSIQRAIEEIELAVISLNQHRSILQSSKNVE